MESSDEYLAYLRERMTIFVKFFAPALVLSLVGTAAYKVGDLIESPWSTVLHGFAWLVACACAVLLTIGFTKSLRAMLRHYDELS